VKLGGVQNGEWLVNKTFRGMAGAAVLFAAGVSSASAQDYTWTLSDFTFGPYMNTASWAAEEPLDEFNVLGVDGGTAAGTITLTKDGSDWSVTAYNFSTSGGATGYSVIYDSANGASNTDVFPVAAGIAVLNAAEDFVFALSWGVGALTDENIGLNSIVSLSPTGSYEAFLGDLQWAEGCVDCGPYYTRFSGPFEVAPSGVGQGALAANGDGTAGQLQLTSIVGMTDVPEPASMAVLGTGLIGLLMSRRRKTA